jgi:MoaA/NifB/PqqE/SkfB family radical SAM enzyme
MLDGKKLLGCEKCYQEEELGRISMRQKANKEYMKFVQPSSPIKFIELSLNNLCNMACVTCTPFDSSKWNDYVDEINYDDIFGGRYQISKTADVLLDYTETDYKTTERVKMLGGEPFLNVKNIEFLEKFPLENILFETHTNCSIIPNKRWNAVLKKIKDVDIRLSIDGFGDVGEFSRYGIQWDQIEKTMDWFIRYKKSRDNVYVGVFSMCHIFNIFDTTNFEEYLNNKGLKYRIDIVHHPDHLDIKILPKSIKERLINTIGYSYVQDYLIKHIDYTDDDQLDKFFIYAERLQKRKHYKFVDKIIEDIKRNR